MAQDKEVAMEKVLAGLAVLYSVALIGCLVMHKLLPEDRWYPVYTGTICVVITVLLLNLPLE